MKFFGYDFADSRVVVAPVRERGLKSAHQDEQTQANTVAPVRERGLKSAGGGHMASMPSRSRKGAWIEIWWCW